MEVRFMVAAVLFAASATASATSSIRPLLLTAIDAPDGKATGELVGEPAQKFRNSTGSNSPVMAEVITIKHISEGCKRLSLRIWQNDVPTVRGKTTLAIDYGLNICRDGGPAGEE